MQIALPLIFENPRKYSVYPNTKSKWEPLGMIFLANNDFPPMYAKKLFIVCLPQIAMWE